MESHAFSTKLKSPQTKVSRELSAADMAEIREELKGKSPDLK